MTITPAAISAAYYNPLVKQGCFDADTKKQVNALAAANDILVATSQNAAFGYAGFGTAITLLPATAPAGTYLCTIYGVVTTTITVATSGCSRFHSRMISKRRPQRSAPARRLTAGTARARLISIPFEHPRPSHSRLRRPLRGLA